MPKSAAADAVTPAPVDASQRPLPRDVKVLSVVAFFVAVGFGVIVPVLPVFARSFGVGNFAVGAVVSGFALLRLATAPAAPLLSRRIGERSTLAVGMLVVAASSVGAGFAHAYWQLLVMRALGGIGSALFSVSAMTLLVRAVDSSMRGRASAVYSSGFLIGGMAGPAMGAVFASISLRAPFFFYALTLTAAGAVGLTMLSGRVRSADPAADVEPGHPAASPAAEAPQRLPLREALHDRRYRAALLAVFGQGWQSQGVRSTLVPVIVVTVYGLSPTWTAGAFACAAIVQTIAIRQAGRMVDTRGRRPMMVVQGVVTGVCALAIPWAPDIWVLAAILCVYSFGAAIESTAPTAVVGDVVGPAGGQAIAAFSMMGDVGAIIGPLVAGAISDAIGLRAAFAVGAALLLAGAAYSAGMPDSIEAARRATTRTPAAATPPPDQPDEGAR